MAATSHRTAELATSRGRGYVLRWRLREAHRSLARSRNQRKCGLIRRQDYVEILRQDKPDDRGRRRAHFHGLVNCGSWSACPVCSLRISTRRGDEIHRAIEAHRETGGDVWMATLTIRHDAGAALADMRDAIADAWSFCISGGAWAGTRTFRGWRNILGVVGAIRAFDCTTGPNGWHPHLHVLLFVAGGVSDEDRERFIDWLSDRWARRIEQNLGPEFRPSRDIGVRIQGGRNASWYIAKLGLARELSSMHTKVGRAGHRTPFQVLRDYDRMRRPADRALWLEWVSAMHGKAQITWTRGLRAALMANEPELSDAEILERRYADEHVVYEIPAYLWDRIASVRLAPAALLEAADRGGTIAVERLIRRMMPHLPVDPPRPLRELQAEQDRAENQIRYVAAAARSRRERIRAGIQRTLGSRTNGLWRPVKDSWTPPAGSMLWEAFGIREVKHAS